jgi:aminopeptidase
MLMQKSELNRHMEKLAQLVLKLGVVLEKNQRVLVSANMAHRDFVHVLAEEAYKLGASYVEVEWQDEILARTRLTHAQSHFDYFPQSKIASRQELVDKIDAYIVLRGKEDPHALEGLSADKLGIIGKAAGQALLFYKKAAMSKRIPWVITPVPTDGWAKEVLGQEATALDLWEILVPILKLDQPDPLAAWTARANELEGLIQTINGLKLAKLHFTAPSTDFTVGLMPTSRFIAGRDDSPLGKKLMVNIPSEEAFTSPDYRVTDGRVRCTRPVEVLGTLVEGAWFVFEKGELQDFGAEKNPEVLEQFLAMDERAPYLGEIALVDKFSPIYQSGKIFGDILLDENAACHFAFGSAYPDGITDAAGKSDQELLAMGLNVSQVHLDFMFGSPEINVTGIDSQGTEHPIMEDGQFVL